MKNNSKNFIEIKSINGNFIKKRPTFLKIVPKQRIIMLIFFKDYCYVSFICQFPRSVQENITMTIRITMWNSLKFKIKLFGKLFFLCLPRRSNLSSRRASRLSRRSCFSISALILFCSRASSDWQHCMMLYLGPPRLTSTRF